MQIVLKTGVVIEGDDIEEMTLKIVPLAGVWRTGVSVKWKDGVPL